MTGRACDRCKVNGRPDVPATTFQTHREPGDPAYGWPDSKTWRCDDCAQALRDYARLGGIALEIVVDRPIRRRAR